MVRIVRTGAGSVMVDPSGKASGRGAYLCRQQSCWDVGLSRRTLARALKTDIAEVDRASLVEYARGLPAEPAAAEGREE
jgi:predicted RNA-binding protein YlxR (DUF448 family)